VKNPPEIGAGREHDLHLCSVNLGKDRSSRTDCGFVAGQSRIAKKLNQRGLL